MTRILLSCLLLLTAPTAAADKSFVQVRYHQGHYLVDFNAHIKAPPDRVFLLLTDYNRLQRLSKGIRSSKLLQKLPDGRNRVQVTLRGCFLFFCRKATKVEDVLVPRFGEIRMSMVPELSDFSFGESRWRVLPHAGGTHLIYTADLVPRFRGRFFIKRTLRKNAERTVLRLEQLANNGANNEK